MISILNLYWYYSRRTSAFDSRRYLVTLRVHIYVSTVLVRQNRSVKCLAMISIYCNTFIISIWLSNNDLFAQDRNNWLHVYSRTWSICIGDVDDRHFLLFTSSNVTFSFHVISCFDLYIACTMIDFPMISTAKIPWYFSYKKGSSETNKSFAWNQCKGHQQTRWRWMSSWIKLIKRLNQCNERCIV